MKVANSIVFRVSKIVQNNQFVKDILHSIDKHGGKVLLVGGAVRDLLLDGAIKDLDFEVYGLTLEQLQNILSLFGPVSFIGKSFGVLRLHGLDVDWSLPRKDSSGRHPMVSYDPYMHYHQAFARRDLTINAMGIDMQSMDLIDPYGGLQDLKNKVLKAPDLAFFGQDPLRVLRVMQFASRFGMRIDEQLTQLCTSIDLTGLSVERIEQECKKLLIQGIQPSIGLAWLDTIGQLQRFFPGLVLDRTVCSTLDFAAKLSYTAPEEKWVIMVAVIMSYMPCKKEYTSFQQMKTDDKQPYLDLLQGFMVQQNSKKQIVTCVLYAKLALHTLTDAQVKWLAYWLAPVISVRLVSKYMVLRYGQAQGLALAEQAARLNVIDQPEAPILTGKDFLDVAQGDAIGKLVQQAYTIQIDQGVLDRFILTSLIMNHAKK